MRLIFATGNRHKFRQMSGILAEFGIQLRRLGIELDETRGGSARQIALQKARQAFAAAKKPLIAEDTGVYFEAYRDFPGTMPKRVFEAIGFEGIFRLLKGKRRGARFECAICYMEAPGKCRFFEGKWNGSIAKKVAKPKAHEMPYTKIFIPKGSKKTLAEIPEWERNLSSHRAIAGRKLGKWLAGSAKE